MNKLRYFIAISLTLLAILPYGVGAAYDFEQNTGLNNAAQTSGYAQQKLFGQGGSLESGVSIILTGALSLLGVIFLILMIYGGISWMTAQGNDQKVSKAKDIIMNSITGLVIVAAAYAITYFVVKTFF
ncbi:MAG TPA: hypothetical protein PKI61_03935 [bacterium]|nr:hypothetical protein [bacterium]HPT29777.1 hypothetical protein [bacterium]